MQPGKKPLKSVAIATHPNLNYTNPDVSGLIEALKEPASIKFIMKQFTLKNFEKSCKRKNAML